MIVLRDARSDEATLLAELQERASLAALAHIFPPNPIDVGYTLDF